jgi:hypothetical protein
MRFQRTVRPTLPSFSVAPMTATEWGRKSGSRGWRVACRTSEARSGKEGRVLELSTETVIAGSLVCWARS